MSWVCDCSSCATVGDSSSRPLFSQSIWSRGICCLVCLLPFLSWINILGAKDSVSWTIQSSEFPLILHSISLFWTVPVCSCRVSANKQVVQVALTKGTKKKKKISYPRRPKEWGETFFFLFSFSLLSFFTLHFNHQSHPHPIHISNLTFSDSSLLPIFLRNSYSLLCPFIHTFH